MKDRIFLFIKYFLFWYLFFVACKILFLIYHFHLTRELSFFDIIKVFLYGSKMDLSMAGYLMVIPSLVIVFTSYFKAKMLSSILNVYTIVVLLVTSFLVIADMELYRFWGFRMDTTPLNYMTNPKEVAGSANLLVSILLLIFWAVLFYFSIKIYFKFIGKKLKELQKSNWITMLVFAFMTACLIIPIRGSFGVAPMNVGFVYFHKDKVFANHAAINVIWNIGYALSMMEKEKPYSYMERAKAEQICRDEYTDNGITNKILNNERPNVIILIMESFTNKIIESLGGIKGITPNFTRLSREGVLFTNCYANGDRTDKGVISVLNGYPGHPKMAIINFPKKTEKLPFLSLDMKKQGYYTGFVYGYDIDYAHFRSYFLNAEYDKVISKADFDPSQCNSKWGVHDHFVFNRLFDECNAAPKHPFFFGFASQSSHEPFDVPMETVIPGKDEENMFLNSAYYADRSLGEFIGKAEKTDWWKNTLVIIIADHGMRHPENTPYYLPVKSHIPMLWLGGALAKKDTIIDTFCAQSDVAYTLLHQMRLENKNYQFSQNILSSNTPGFAFYVFNDGFGYLRKNQTVIFDNVAGKTIYQEGTVDDTFLNKGKAHLQVLSTDFSER